MYHYVRWFGDNGLAVTMYTKGPQRITVEVRTGDDVITVKRDDLLEACHEAYLLARAVS